MDKKGLRSSASERANTFPWPPVLLVVAFAAAWLLHIYVPLPWPGVDDLAGRVVGLGLGAAGIILIVWSIVVLARHKTTVLPDGVSNVLVTTGPYTLLRNPIYLGEVLVLLSVAELTKSIWYVIAGIVFAIALTPLQIIPEERHLTARFGEAFTGYKARTRRWI